MRNVLLIANDKSREVLKVYKDNEFDYAIIVRPDGRPEALRVCSNGELVAEYPFRPGGSAEAEIGYENTDNGYN